MKEEIHKCTVTEPRKEKSRGELEKSSVVDSDRELVEHKSKLGMN